MAKTEARYIKVGVHNDKAYIIKQIGPFILTKPFSGGGLTFSSYSADYRVYRLGKDDPVMIGEFPLRRDAFGYLNFLYNKYHLRTSVPPKNYWKREEK